MISPGAARCQGAAPPPALDRGLGRQWSGQGAASLVNALQIKVCLQIDALEQPRIFYKMSLYKADSHSVISLGRKGYLPPPPPHTHLFHPPTSRPQPHIALRGCIKKQVLAPKNECSPKSAFPPLPLHSLSSVPWQFSTRLSKENVFSDSAAAKTAYHIFTFPVPA